MELGAVGKKENSRRLQSARYVPERLNDQPPLQTEKRFKMERLSAYRDRHQDVVPGRAQSKAAGPDPCCLIGPLQTVFDVESLLTKPSKV